MTMCKRWLITLFLMLLLGPGASITQAQLKVDFTRAPDDEPLQDGWEPFQGDGTDFWTESFNFGGKSIDVTLEGNTHWRDYREATNGYEVLGSLLRDGPLCNDFCEMSLTLENLSDGDYEIRTYFHTTQFGPQDGRPFTPFSISLTDGSVRNDLIAEDVLMSDDSSDELSTETIPFTVVGGSPVMLLFEKPGGSDHFALPGFELATPGNLPELPNIEPPPPPTPIDENILPDGLKIDFSRNDDEPLQDGWEPFPGEGTEIFTEEFEFEGGSVEVTIEGNTHWRDYRPATGAFADLSDLLSDGPLCNNTCTMTITLGDMRDGDYEFTAILHTTQFGEQDGRPFTPFDILLSDGKVSDELVVEEALMSDDSSDELSFETIPFSVVGGSSVEISFDKLGGNDHLALAGLILSTSGPQGDFNGDGILDAADIDLLSEDARTQMNTPKFDLNADGAVDDVDRTVWVKDVRRSWFGDANLDGEFNSADFVSVFQAGKFEKEEDASWAEGDWNGDGRFSSGDFVVAFQDGGFEKGPLAATVPEPSCAVILLAVWFALPMVRRFSGDRNTRAH